MTDSAVPPNLLRSRLLADHDDLEGLFLQLLAAVATDDGAAVMTLWNGFDAALVRHFEAEERFLVPQLFSQRPRDARTILEEHRYIRSRVAELGLGAKQGVLRLEAARGFVEELRAHARHEDEVLYRWADGRLAAGEQSALVDAIEGAPRRKGHAA